MSSAKRDDVDVAAGVTSSPKRDFELSDELAGGVSVGELPNKDILKCFQGRCKRVAKTNCVLTESSSDWSVEFYCEEEARSL